MIIRNIKHLHHGEVTIQHNKLQTQHNKLQWGHGHHPHTDPISTAATQTISIVNTRVYNYSLKESTPNKIIQGASKRGEKALAPDSKEFNLVMRDQMAIKKFREVSCSGSQSESLFRESVCKLVVFMIDMVERQL